MKKKLKMKKKNDPITEEKQCIICGTLIDDLDPEDFTKIKQGYICNDCLADGWFIKCEQCGDYEFENDVSFIEEEDLFLCKSCYQKRSHNVQRPKES